MALFCSECGKPLTERMKRCPQCGAEVLYPTCRDESYTSLTSIIAGMGVVIALCTLFRWYGMSLNIDGGGGLDAIANLFTGIIPGYSGISTTFGMICLALTLGVVIFALCRLRILTLLMSLSCVGLTTIAITQRPDFMELNETHTSNNSSIVELFDGPMPIVEDVDGTLLRSISNIAESATEYVNIEIGYGLKIALMASIATTLLALADLILYSRYNSKRKKTL